MYWRWSMKNSIIQGVVMIIILLFVSSAPFVIINSFEGVKIEYGMMIELLQSIPSIDWLNRIDAAFIERMVRTFILLLVAMLLGLTFALVLGLFVARFKVFRLFRGLIEVIAIIPDFIIIIFSVVLGVQIYQWTGIRVMSFMPDKNTAHFWFPVMVLSIAPALYFLKLIHVRFLQISGEDYVRTAVSKGLDITTINLQYVYRNMQPFIHAELTKGLSLTIGNLFIVEYLLNVIGLTHYIFAVKDFPATLLGLCALLIIALFVFLIIKFILFLFRKGLIYE